MSKRAHGLFVGAFVVGLMGMLAGCGLSPSVMISDGNQDFTQGQDDFGRVALTLTATKQLTVSNSGGTEVRLGDLSARGLSLVTPFGRQGGSCAPGQTLQRGQSCTLTVTFQPLAEGVVQSPLVLTYTENNQTFHVSGTLIGQGFVDCSASEELQSSRAKGVAAAQTRMSQEAQQGTADGQALTSTDGYNDGYQSSYSSGWNSIYNTAYNQGFSDGESDGVAQGAADDGACAEGQNAGLSDGYDAGYSDGASDAYDASYNQGYSDGQDDQYQTGYDDGYSDGYGVCTSPRVAKAASVAEADTAPADPTLVSACYQQGYTATYSRSAYDDAYAAAKAANQAYQSGLSQGSSDGWNQGAADGQSTGYSDGYSAGDSAGYAEGEQAAYDSCYQPAYDSSYNNGYSDGSYDSADSGYNDGYADGQSDGYDSGYSDGYDDGQTDGGCD